jgi:hypothetical protein
MVLLPSWTIWLNCLKGATFRFLWRSWSECILVICYLRWTNSSLSALASWLQVYCFVLSLIDDGRNPDEFTRAFINSCITKNQVTKEKTDAFKVLLWLCYFLWYAVFSWCICAICIPLDIHACNLLCVHFVKFII